MTIKVKNTIWISLIPIVSVLLSCPLRAVRGSEMVSGNLNRSFRVEHLTTEDGLSQNTIVSILKDSRGFMWFATWNGLNRYDGYSFKKYKKEDNSHGISSNFIYSLCEDVNGDLWIGTRYGLNKFIYKKNRFIHYFYDSLNKNGISDNWVNVVYCDREGILWVGTNGHGLDRSTGSYKNGNISFKNYVHSNSLSNSVIGNQVQCIYEDKESRLWIGTFSGLSVLNKATGTFSNFSYDPSFPQGLGSNNIQCVYEDSKGTIWVGTQFGLYRWVKNTKRFIGYYNNPDDPNSLAHSTVNAIREDAAGNLLIATLGGLDYYRPKSNDFGHFPLYMNSEYSLNNEFINALYCDNNGLVWAGTEKGGINKFNIYQKQFEFYSDDPESKMKLSNNTVNSIMVEKNNIWVGTAGGGLDLLDKKNGTTRYFRTDPHRSDQLSSNFVTSICRDKSGNLWIATWGMGFDKMLTHGNHVFFRHHMHNNNTNSLVNDFVSAIYQDSDGNLWIATEGGLDLFNPENNSYTHIFNHPDSSVYITEVGCILRDKTGNMWIGTRNGLFYIPDSDIGPHGQIITAKNIRYLHNNPNDQFSLSENYVISLFEDHKGQLWIGTYGNGINKLLSRKHNGNSFRFEHFTQKDGLSNNVIYGIQEDDKGNLWLSTDFGLSKFNVGKNIFRNYYVTDGLQSNQFYWSASCKANDGTLYFGGMKGVNYFKPDNIKDNTKVPTTVITEFKIDNIPVNVGLWNNKKTILDQVISETKVIHLTYRENSFSFEFSALNYDLPEKNRYAYKMDNIDQNWVYVSSDRRFANYTKLKGGEYTFRVKASNNDGLWSNDPTIIKIIIDPPFWATAWFKILLILILIGSVIAYLKLHTRSLHIQKRKLEQQVRERTAEISMQKEQLLEQAARLQETNIQLARRQELIEGQKVKLETQNKEIADQRDKLLLLNKKVEAVNQLKIRFFTNISHEFRTPLTLILGPLDKLRQNWQGDEEGRDTLNLISRNAQRLLHLINQLMDFRKIERGKIDLTVSRGNMREFIGNIVYAFHELADERNIKLCFEFPESVPETWFDHEKIEKVIYNLLSNAFKYTPHEGKVWVSLKFCTGEIQRNFNGNGKNHQKSDFMEIKVGDTGIGISEEKLQDIFKRFYHTDSVDMRDTGSGIGLSLVKELLRTHHGDIHAESSTGVGTVFTIHIPYKKECYTAEEISDRIYNGSALINDVSMLRNELTQMMPGNGKEKSKVVRARKDIPTLLLVEDNADLRQFVTSRLNASYNILEAANGRKGLEMATGHDPDLIISDIMMPEMDGLSMCKFLKENLATSHIPVILLTARSTIENQIEGFETGADEYLPKPFNFELLEARIRNLIESRKRLRELFSGMQNLLPEEITTNPTDKKFLEKALQLVESNLDNSEFDVNDFASNMNVSRSFLHKKLTALTDQSATDFINTIRLKRSVELLTTMEFNVSEVAYAVGYNDPKYFSRIFKKQFGKAPSDYLKQPQTEEIE